jgi:hypothetical protein
MVLLAPEERQRQAKRHEQNAPEGSSPSEETAVHPLSFPGAGDRRLK